MAQTTTSAPQQQVNMPAVDLRQLYGTAISFEGVRGANDLAVSQRAAGANMSVDVAAGTAAIQDDHASGGGFYSYTLATATNYPVTTADPTNPRVDRVVIRVRDQALGDAANDAVPVVVAGTPTAGATLSNLNGAAAVPASSLLLANILIPAAGTSVTTANIARAARLVNEAAYNAFGASVTVSATTEATATLIGLADSVTFDGLTTVWVECAVPYVTSATSPVLTFCLYDGASSIGLLGQQTVVASAFAMPRILPFRVTPSAAAHTYALRAFVSSGTATVASGAGGAGAFMPGYIRITKA